MSELIFQEKLRPSIGFLLALCLSFPMISLALAPFGLALSLLSGLIGMITLIALALLGSPTIRVTSSELTAGTMRIPRSALGRGEPIEPDRVFLERGPLLDPKAAHLLRGDIKGLVKIPIVDPADPTPYLLLSTRKSEEIIRALN